MAEDGQEYGQDLDQHGRLRLARSLRYASASDAARALGVPVPTYGQHENGTRGFFDIAAAAAYARFFRVRLEWLLTGQGEMRAAALAGARIPVRGYIGAGAMIDPIRDMGEPPFEYLALPGEGRIEAFVVKGDSMRPRFLAGEIVLFDPEPLLPAELADRYAIVETDDGRTLIKILRRGRREGVWRLDSFNLDSEEDVIVRAARRYLGTLPGDAAAPAAEEVARLRAGQRRRR